MALDDPARSRAVRARYGEAVDAPRITWNAVIELLLGHRSTRSFTAGDLPEDTIETLVAAAQSAPTSSNLQLWSVIAVTDRADKVRYAMLAGNQRHVDEAPLLLLFVADLARARAVGAQAGRAVEATDYLDVFLAASIDATLAAQNAAIAAASLGLGTVYIGGLRNDPLAVADAAGLPDGSVVVFGLAVGRPDPARAGDIKPRLPQAAVLHRGRYGTAATKAAIAEHDVAARQFQEAQRLPQHGWSAMLLHRLADAAALGPRRTLRQALQTLGFGLR